MLLQDLEHHHARPPVIGLVDLCTPRWWPRAAAGFEQTGTDVPVFALVFQGPLHPGHGLGDQLFIPQKPGQGIQSVDPVWTALPGVPIAAQPGIARPGHLGIPRVQVAGHAGGHAGKLILQPTIRSNCTEGQFGIGFGGQGCAVEKIERAFLTGRAIDHRPGRSHQRDKGNQNQMEEHVTPRLIHRYLGTHAWNRIQSKQFYHLCCLLGLTANLYAIYNKWPPMFTMIFGVRKVAARTGVILACRQLVETS